MAYRGHTGGGARRIGLCLIVLAGGGCFGPMKVPTDYAITGPPSGADRIPLRVGLYMSPQFGNYSGNFGRGFISLGEAMSSGAERALRTAIEEVVIIKQLESRGSTEGVRAIVAPEIVEARMGNSDEKGFHKGHCQVWCKWTVSTPEGKLVYVNTVLGEAHHDRRAPAPTVWTECMTLAVQDQYRKLVEIISSTQWWQSIR